MVVPQLYCTSQAAKKGDMIWVNLTKTQTPKTQVRFRHFCASILKCQSQLKYELTAAIGCFTGLTDFQTEAFPKVRYHVVYVDRP